MRRSLGMRFESNSVHAPRFAGIPLFIVAALAGLATGCGAAAIPPPRLIVAGRFTSHANGRSETAASASLVLPEARPRATPLDAPPPVALLDADGALPAPSTEGDPEVETVVERVLASRRFDPERARDARERARLSGLLPVVRADLRRGSGWDLRTQQGFATDTAILRNDDSWSIVGSVTFRFDRLVFARDETALLAEERRLEEARLRLLGEVLRLHAERRRLLGEQARRGATDLVTEARLAEIDAMLDVLTEGGMSQRR